MPVLKINDLAMEAILTKVLQDFSTAYNQYFAGIKAWDTAGTEVASTGYGSGTTSNFIVMCIGVEAPNKIVFNSNNASGLEFKVNNVGNGVLDTISFWPSQSFYYAALYSGDSNRAYFDLKVGSDITADHTALTMNQTINLNNYKLAIPQEINV